MDESAFPAQAFSEDDVADIHAVYQLLLKAGDTTKTPDGEWDPWIDGAHQSLGVLLAMIAAHQRPQGSTLRIVRP